MPNGSKPIGHDDNSSKNFIAKCLKGDNTHGFDIEGIYYWKNTYYVFEYLKCESERVNPHTSDPKYYPYNYKKFISLYEFAKKLNGILVLVNYSDDKINEDKVRVMEVDKIDYDALKKYIKTPFKERPKHLKYIYFSEDRKMTFEEYSTWLRKINKEATMVEWGDNDAN